MISEPARYIDELVNAGVNWISAHVETDPHLDRTLHYIRQQGVRAGVAINPATPVGALEQVLPDVDYVLVMSVNPGFGGQQFIPSTLKKIRKLCDTISSNRYHARIEVDGGIGVDNLEDVLSAGADIIVAGSAIFGAEGGAAKAVQEMKGIADRHVRVLETT
jgi:ribulose-phosphate 3-epimerase